MGKTDYHAKGEKDCTEGRYSPPVNMISMLLTGTDDDIKANKEYDAGYENAKKQRR